MATEAVKSAVLWALQSVLKWPAASIRPTVNNGLNTIFMENK